MSLAISFWDHFTFAAKANHFWLCHASMRGSHPLPDQLPGEHTGHMPQAAHRSSWYNRLHCCHSHTHSHVVTADRSMVVGHVPTVHTCSFMCTNHIDMIAHTPAFLRVGEHSHHLDFHHCKQRIAGLFFFFPKLFQHFSHGEIRTRDLPLGKWVP